MWSFTICGCLHFWDRLHFWGSLHSCKLSFSEYLRQYPDPFYSPLTYTGSICCYVPFSPTIQHFFRFSTIDLLYNILNCQTISCLIFFQLPDFFQDGSYHNFCNFDSWDSTWDWRFCNFVEKWLFEVNIISNLLLNSSLTLSQVGGWQSPNVDSKCGNARGHRSLVLGLSAVFRSQNFLDSSFFCRGISKYR